MLPKQLELNDYRELNGSVYVYAVDQHKIIEEVKTGQIGIKFDGRNSKMKISLYLYILGI